MKYTIDNPKLVEYIHDPEENNFTGVVKDKYGNIAYHEDGEYHKTDGPAIISAKGSKEWRIYGELHREDGPAVEWYNGDKEWRIHGKKHREDGPAIECANGDKEWWYNYKYYGQNNDFTAESWIKKWKLEIFK